MEATKNLTCEYVTRAGFMEEVTVATKARRYAEFYMACAFEAAKLSYANKRKVGAIAVYKNNIVGFGFNGTPAGHDNCCEDEQGNTLPSVIHAEENLLNKLAELQGVSRINHLNLNGYDIYVTKEPCIKCAKLIASTKSVLNVVYREDSKTKPLEGGRYLADSLGVKVFRMPAL